jgi:N-acyl-D-aspartate/D-glutamate deacylase
MPMLARVEGMPLESLQQGVPWDWSSFGSYLDKIDGTLAINAGFLAGHSAIRRVVMGDRAVRERADAAELAAMQQLLRESIAQGALGFSTTVSNTHNDAAGQPVPSRHASREEILALAAICREYEGTSIEMVPGAEFTPEIVALLSDFSLAAQRPVNWNPLAVNNGSAQERAHLDTQLAASDRARERGARVVALTVPQTMTIRINFLSGFVFDAVPGWADLFQLPPAQRLEKLRDPAYRRHLEPSATGERGAGWLQFFNWDKMTIDQTFSPATQIYQGKTLAQAAALSGRPPFDTLLDIAIADDLKTSFMPFTGGDDRDTYALRAQLWRDTRTVIGGSDAGAHLDMIDTFAFTTKVLQKGVREYGLLSLEEAVHMLSLAPAQLMGLRERGQIKTGWHADLVIFNPDTVACGPTYTRFDMPAGAGRLYADASGIDEVLVNGQVIIRAGSYTGAAAGTVLRCGRDTYTVPLAAAAD